MSNRDASDVPQYHQVVAEDAASVVALLTTHQWPFHGFTHISHEQAQRWLDTGAFVGTNNVAVWIEARGDRIGIVRLVDLEADEPTFDLRLAAHARGRGLGTATVRWITRYFFELRPAERRFNTQVRQDNIAMRKALERCGWVKESHWREAWRDHATGTWYDGVAYAILRRDWESGATTPVIWDS